MKDSIQLSNQRVLYKAQWDIIDPSNIYEYLLYARYPAGGTENTG